MLYINNKDRAKHRKTPNGDYFVSYMLPKLSEVKIVNHVHPEYKLMIAEPLEEDEITFRLWSNSSKIPFENELKAKEEEKWLLCKNESHPRKGWWFKDVLKEEIYAFFDAP